MAVRLRESLRCSIRRDAQGAARESANTYIRTGQMGVKMRRRAVQPGEAWRGESSRGVARRSDKQGNTKETFLSK